MLFAVITSYDDVMPPFISPYDLTLNMEAYIKCLQAVVLPLVMIVFAEKPHVRQGDSASGQTSKGTQS